jgi:hypothetical protein
MILNQKIQECLSPLPDAWRAAAESVRFFPHDADLYVALAFWDWALARDFSASIRTDALAARQQIQNLLTHRRSRGRPRSVLSPSMKTIARAMYDAKLKAHRSTEGRALGEVGRERTKREIAKGLGVGWSNRTRLELFKKQRPAARILRLEELLALPVKRPRRCS